MDEILARLRLNEPKKSPSSNAPSGPKKEPKTIRKLLTNLNGHSQALNKQRMDLINESDSDGPKDEGHSSDSNLYTPATEPFDVISPDHNDGGTSRLEDAAEIHRVKQELAAAQFMISRQEQELAETRKLKHTMDQAMGPPSEADFAQRTDISEQTISHLQSAFNASARPFTSRNDSWHPQDDARSDESDALSAGGYNRARGIWNNTVQPQLSSGLNTTPQPCLFNDPRSGLGLEWTTGYGNQTFSNQNSLGGNQRLAHGSTTSPYGFDGRYGNEQIPVPGQNIGLRRTMSQFNRAAPNFGNRANPYGSYPTPLPNINPASLAPMGIPATLGYQPGTMSSPLSPTMPSFTSSSLRSPWSSVVLPLSLRMIVKHLLTTTVERWKQSDLCYTSRTDELSSFT
jgi:hypothetical protein